MPLGALGNPARLAARGTRDEIEPDEVAAQNALLPVLDHRVEQPVAREQLPRVLAHPQP